MAQTSMYSNPLSSDVRLLLSAFAVVCGTGPCLAQTEIPTFTHAGALRSQPVDQTSSPRDAAPAGSAELVPHPGQGPAAAFFLDTNGNARIERIRFWTATVNMTKNEGCTGTMIGPLVLLTAAHCIERSPVIRLEFELSETPFILADCQKHPLYRPRGYFTTIDYGLCHLREPYPDKVPATTAGEPPEIKAGRAKYPVYFERLNIRSGNIRPRRAVLLAGYGCFSKTSTEFDGRLRAGISTIRRYSQRLAQLSGGGILCFGDSGGAAFRFLTRDPYGPRVVVGVNMASNLPFGLSYIARTSAPTFVRFLNSWRRRWGNPKICGLDKEIDVNCHP